MFLLRVMLLARKQFTLFAESHQAYLKARPEKSKEWDEAFPDKDGGGKKKKKKGKKGDG